MIRIPCYEAEKLADLFTCCWSCHDHAAGGHPTDVEAIGGDVEPQDIGLDKNTPVLIVPSCHGPIDQIQEGHPYRRKELAIWLMAVRKWNRDKRVK